MRAQFLVLTNAVAGQDAAFDRWYDDVHLGEVCAVPGVVDARRSHSEDDAAPYRYCAVYDIDASDPQECVGEIFRRYNAGEMTLTDTMHETWLTTLFLPGKVYP